MMLQRILTSALALLIALWLGGVLWLMLGVQSLFAARREIAVEAAPMLFGAFERYQLLLAVLTITAAFALWRTLRRRQHLALFTVVAFATAAVLISSLWITPSVEALRLAGEGGSPQFKTLHGISMLLYVMESILLAAAIVTLTWRSDLPAAQP